MHLYRKNYTILPLSRKTEAKILQKRARWITAPFQRKTTGAPHRPFSFLGPPTPLETSGGRSAPFQRFRLPTPQRPRKVPPTSFIPSAPLDRSALLRPLRPLAPSALLALCRAGPLERLRTGIKNTAPANVKEPR